jgi:parallel beta-helix repeat protein
VIESNRIHNCGRMPAANHDHGIYLNDANDTEIVGNLIYDNADRGIQLYPNAQRTHIAGNVIDGNGEGIIFSGAGNDTSNDNIAEDNIISNSKERNNVESFYPDGTPVGRGNIVRDNCIAGGVRDDGDGGISEWRVGFTVGSGNVLSKNPKFVDRGAKDFRLQDDSPCAGVANRATKSNGSRVQVTAPTDGAPAGTDSGNSGSTTDVTGPGRTSARPVSLRMIASRHGRLRLHGRVRHKSSQVRSAGAARATALIQIRWAGAWYPLATVRVVDGRFSAKLRIPRHMRGRVLKLRAVVPTVGASHSVRVRAR